MHSRERSGRPGVSRAFTLIEMLVVVAVIALLAAILLPGLRAAREAGRSSVCLSNIRQIGLAVRMYADANRDAVVALAEEAEGYRHWLELLQPYVKTAGLARCPADASIRWEPDQFRPRSGMRTTSFASNVRMSPDASGLPDKGVRTLSQVRRPARKIFLAEYIEEQAGDHFHPDSWLLFTSRPEDEIAMRRHRVRSNYWFVDGHAEPLVFEHTWNAEGSVDLYDPRR